MKDILLKQAAVFSTDKETCDGLVMSDPPRSCQVQGYERYHAIIFSASSKTDSVHKTDSTQLSCNLGHSTHVKRVHMFAAMPGVCSVDGVCFGGSPDYMFVMYMRQALSPRPSQQAHPPVVYASFVIDQREQKVSVKQRSSKRM